MSATNRGSARSASDFYPTPQEAFIPLLQYLPRCEKSDSGSVKMNDSGLVNFRHYWEPACGDGRIIRWLSDSGRIADGADIRQGVSYDYLKDKTMRDIVITNPPFSLAFEFCKHARQYSKETYLLLRLNFLASAKRAAWWKKNPPSALFILSKRPSFTGNGTDATDCAWFAWGSELKGFYWL